VGLHDATKIHCGDRPGRGRDAVVRGRSDAQGATRRHLNASVRDNLLAVAGIPFAIGGGIIALYFAGLAFSVSGFETLRGPADYRSAGARPIRLCNSLRSMKVSA
jgi:hypothetical protein